jgi:hypothetical protein
VPLSHRAEIVLAALAAGGPDVNFAPVQVQKLFFLVDRNIAADVGGAQFNFEPYDYGPFDSSVYAELEQLRREGFVRIEATPWADRRRYFLTPAGHEHGAEVLGRLSTRAQDYLARVTAWIRSLNFAQLVGAIYQQYPEMKENSVFRAQP